MLNIKYQMKKLKSKRASFTLVEVLVSMVILMMLIGGMVRIEISNTRLADSGKKQLQATGLARGQLNLVRTIRDFNILNGISVFDEMDLPDPPTSQPNIKHLYEINGRQILERSSTSKSIDGTDYTIEITVTE